MKKAVLAVGLLLAGSFENASAQSSMTLYGIVDNGLAYVSNIASGVNKPGSSSVQAVSGFGSGDRFGLTGKENLGGGTSAVFTLESGFNGNNGVLVQGGRLFGRQAFAGLDNDRWGTMTLGRQYDFNFDYLAPYLAWLQFGSIYGAHIGDVDNTWATFRLNNTVKYQLKPFAGLSLGALYAFSNQASGDAGTGFANNRAYSLGANYKAGSWSAALTWLHVSNPSSSAATGSNPNGAIGGEYSSASTIFYNVGFVTEQNVYGVALGYRFQNANVNFVFTNTHLDYEGGHSMRVDNYEINGRYFVTPAMMLGIAYIFTDGSGYTGTGATAFATGNRPKWHQVDVGATYLLSKRTDIHLSGIYQRAAGDASTAALNVLGPAGTGNTSQLAIVIGLRHRF